MNGTGRAFRGGVDDGGVVANGGDLIFGVQGKNHGVMKKGFSGGRLGAVPRETMFENGAGFHFPARSEKFGQFAEADIEKGVLGGFHQMKADAFQVGPGGAPVSRGEIGGDEFEGVAQTKAGAWWGSLWAAATTEQVSCPFWVLMPVSSPGWRPQAPAKP